MDQYANPPAIEAAGAAFRRTGGRADGPQLKRDALDSESAMRFLEAIEIEEWCAGHGLHLDSRTGLAPNPSLVYSGRSTFAEGRRSARESSVASACIQALGNWTECLLWITQWGVWPSGEDWPAYYALRGAQSERRSLSKAPGHLFADGETVLAETYLTQVLENAWDAWLLPAAPSSAEWVRVHVSHDEFIDLYSSSPTSFGAVGVQKG